MTMLVDFRDSDIVAEPVFIHVNHNIACYAYGHKGKAELQKLYEEYEGASTGRAILTGKISNIFAIDIDNTETYEKLLADNNLTDFSDYTYCETSARGVHAYFTMPEQLAHLSVGTNKPFKDWDFRNNNGYCVFAGSNYTTEICTKMGKKPHKCGAKTDAECKFNGKTYEALNECPYAEMPENLIKLYLCSMDKPLQICRDSEPAQNGTDSPQRAEIIKYLDMMDSKKILDNRDNWIKFMFLCKQNNLTADDFHHYSSRAETHEPCCCYSKWAEPHKPNNNITIGTAKMWARDSNPEEYYKMFQVANCFDYDDTYTYYAFRQEFLNKRFESFSELETAIFDKCKSVVVYGTEPQTFIAKTKTGIQYYKNLGNSGFTIYYRIDEDRYKKIEISKYILSKPKLSFANIDCILNRAETPPETFNTWAGYKARITNSPDEETISAINKFIFEVWADGDEEMYNYVVSWFASIVQRADINGVALVCVSKQGCGKNTLIDFFKLILGENAVSENTGICSITQKHNTIIENKRLNVVNEMSSTRDEFRSSFDKLKSLITDDRITIEPKGLPSYKIRNIGNYILFTNHADSVIVEQSDRRYNVAVMSDIHQNDYEYFENLRNRHFNQHGANSYYTFLMNYTICNVHKIIQTKARTDMAQLSKPTAMRFIEEFPQEHGITMRANELYGAYVSWCKENGEKQMTNTKFGIIAKTILESARDMKGTYYVF